MMRSSHLRKMIQICSRMVTRKHVGTVTTVHIWFVIAISRGAKSGARRRAAVLACVNVITRSPNGKMVEFWRLLHWKTPAMESLTPAATPAAVVQILIPRTPNRKVEFPWLLLWIRPAKEGMTPTATPATALQVHLTVD